MIEIPAPNVWVLALLHLQKVHIWPGGRLGERRYIEVTRLGVECAFCIPLGQLWWGQAAPPQTPPGSPCWSTCRCYVGQTWQQSSNCRPQAALWPERRTSPPRNAAPGACKYMSSSSGIFTASSRGIGRLALRSRQRDVCDVSGQGWDSVRLALGSHPTASSWDLGEDQPQLSKVSLLSGYSEVSKLISVAFLDDWGELQQRIPDVHLVLVSAKPLLMPVPGHHFPRQACQCKCKHFIKVNYISICFRKMP